MVRNKTVILDFGSSKLVGLVGEDGINGQLRVFTKVEEPYDGFKNSRFIDEEGMKAAVMEVISGLERSNVKISKLFVGVPAEFALATVGDAKDSYLRNKKMKFKDVKSICDIAYQSYVDTSKYTLLNKNTIDFTLDDTRKVLNPINKEAEKIKASISFIYVESYFVNTLVPVLEAMGVKEVEFVSSSLAESLYVFDDFEREKDVVLVDVGAKTTSISVTRGEGLISISSFSLGGENFTQDLMQCLDGGLDHKAAEDLKRRLMINVPPTDKDIVILQAENGEVHRIKRLEANKVIESRLDDFIDKLSRALRELGRFRKNTKTLYITGGGVCYLKGAVDYISRATGYDIEVRNAYQLSTPKPEYASELGVLRMAIDMERYA